MTLPLMDCWSQLECEFLSGAWLAAAGLYEVGLLAQHHMGSGGINFDEDEMIQSAVLHLAYILPLR